MICSNCRGKVYEPNPGDDCPYCGEPFNTPRDNKVQQWNSTLKADPTKKPKRSGYIRPRKKGAKNLAKTMRDFVHQVYPGYNGQAVTCSNCGHKIKTLKYENISHIEPRSLAPGKAHDFENMEILCGPTDYWGQKDESCHTLWERGQLDKFKQKGKNHGIVKADKKGQS